MSTTQKDSTGTTTAGNNPGTNLFSSAALSKLSAAQAKIDKAKTDQDRVSALCDYVKTMNAVVGGSK